MNTGMLGPVRCQHRWEAGPTLPYPRTAPDLEGEELGAFAPPGSTSATRAPVYVAVDDAGRVYVTDRLQHAVFVYDRDGNHLDTLLDPQSSVADLASEAGCEAGERTIAVDIFTLSATCRSAAGEEQDIPLPQLAAWSPLGIRFDADGRALVTDVTGDSHKVQILSDGLPSAVEPAQVLGASIADRPETLVFPNVAVSGPGGRIYVTDGNNARIAIWDADGTYIGAFGRGTGEAAFALPRGAVLDHKDRLHVVDAVSQAVLVYVVSGSPKAMCAARVTAGSISTTSIRLFGQWASRYLGKT